MTSSKKPESDEDGYRRKATMKFSTYIENRPEDIKKQLKDFCVASELDRNLFIGVFEDQKVLQEALVSNKIDQSLFKTIASKIQNKKKSP